MRSLQQAAGSVKSNFCAKELFELAHHCRRVAKSGQAPVTVALGLADFFHLLANSIDDQAVDATRIADLLSRLKSLLELLETDGIKPGGRFGSQIEKQLLNLRDLIP